MTAFTPDGFTTQISPEFLELVSENTARAVKSAPNTYFLSCKFFLVFLYCLCLHSRNILSVCLTQPSFPQVFIHLTQAAIMRSLLVRVSRGSTWRRRTRRGGRVPEGPPPRRAGRPSRLATRRRPRKSYALIPICYPQVIPGKQKLFFSQN